MCSIPPCVRIAKVCIEELHACNFEKHRCAGYTSVYMSSQDTDTAVKVRTGNFEGPLSLLLELIEARKLFINEISLAEVAEEYIEHIRNRGELPLGETTQFIAIAATLILIKSRSLLPNLSLTEEEETKIVDLEHRLRLYQLVRDATVPLGEAWGKNMLFFGPPRGGDMVVFSPDPQLSKQLFLDAVSSVLAQVPTPVFHPEVAVVSTVSIEEMIDSLEHRIQSALEMSFRDFSRSGGGTEKEQKVFVIVSFLAMLELVRQGIIDAVQSDAFGDIGMKRETAVRVPLNEESDDLAIPDEQLT
jgi:segregation and condensation protein A